MITDAEIKQQSDAERTAWLASLNENESAIAHCPVGHRYTLVWVSIVKMLLVDEMPSAYRLKFLEWLNKCGDQWLSAEMVAAIEPMCAEGYEIVREAQKLGAGKSLDVFARHEVFSAFIALNPSILAAIKIPRRYQQRSA
jgi:hypothetical protein